MTNSQYRLLVSDAVALVSCTFSPNVREGQIHCYGPTECPSGYTCVTAGQKFPGVCCRDLNCRSSLMTPPDGGGGDGPMTMLDSLASEVGTNDTTVGAPDAPQGSTPDVPAGSDVAQDQIAIGTGGTTGTGGTIGTGGTTSLGGTTSVGGTAKTGGTTVAGGSTGLGGSVNSGGTRFSPSWEAKGRSMCTGAITGTGTKAPPLLG